jgi:hypothetical protein
VNSDPIKTIARSKDAERKRLRDLPWLEKLEMLDQLRDRHRMLQATRVKEGTGTTNQ